MSEMFSDEPEIGHKVTAEVYRPESPFSDVLADVAESYGVPRHRRVKITRGDVDWDGTQSISLDLATFEKIIEWYESQQ